MKKEWFTYCLRLLVLLVMTCSRGEVFAKNITSTTNISSNYTYNEAVTVTNTGTLTVNSGYTLTINGDLTINGTLKLNDNASLIVKGNVIFNGSYNPSGGWGGGTTQTQGVKIIIQGNFTINKDKTFDFGHQSGNGVKASDLIVEGDVTINGTLKTHKDRIVFKHSVTGSGSVTVSKSTTIALLCLENDDIISGVSFTTDKTEAETADDVYSPQQVYVKNGKAQYTSSSSTSSEAYTNAISLLNDNANLLPIELTSFTVSATEYGYTFNWVTASEVENDYFTLEFSEDGEEFIAIDYVSGAGTTSETTEYEYVWDAKPTAEILYFRLKQTDYNGEFTYSDILVYAPKKSHGATRTLYYGPLKLNVVDGQLQYIAE